jgi:hypothetical protein
MLHKFKKPVKWEGQEVNEIELNLENINAKKSFEVDRKFKQENPSYIGIPILENQYVIMLAQSVSDKPLEFFENLGLGEMFYLVNQVRSFLERI